jgi:hypothetical protein
LLAFTVDRSSLWIYNDGGATLLDYNYSWSEDHSTFAVIIDREFEDVIDSLYLGTMIVGDSVWGSIHLSGYQFATATAQAYSPAGAFALCDIVSRFQFELNAQEVQPSPVPEPSTMLLIGTGLIGLAGFRRRFSK